MKKDEFLKGKRIVVGPPEPENQPGQGSDVVSQEATGEGEEEAVELVFEREPDTEDRKKLKRK